ncbi:MAG: ABC transporter ATP-binding protein [bacterium]|nr:ABC transporter ATP-binding protein [bacterium]
METKILEVKNLKKVYNKGKTSTQALADISFDVTEGEIFGILGPNGAGKSTTLHILIGLLTPSSGSVKIFGKNFFEHEEEIKTKMNIATAYAELAQNLTVYQNLKVFAHLYGVKNYKKKIEDLLEQFQITDLRDERIDRLSAGQKTRINLCKSLINDPEFLLLDEPTASLDPAIAAHVRAMFLEIQKKRKLTIIFTSHNMPEVEQMCDRVALLNKGKIYKIDTPKNLQKFLEVPTMEEVFIKLASGDLTNEEHND